MLIVACVVGAVVLLMALVFGANSNSEAGQIVGLLALIALVLGFAWVVVSGARWLWHNPLF